MIPYLIGATITYLFIEILSEITDKSISEFDKDNIVTDYAKLFKPSQETIAKIHITKTINKLTKRKVKFKIGKTGMPDNRKKQHKEFSKMYIIAESKNDIFINKLEAIYNEKFIDNKKNVNYKIGSAGKMTDKTGRYFLYLIIK